MKICGSFAGALATGQGMLSTAEGSLSPKLYNRVRLVQFGKDFHPDQLPVGKSFIFNYPYVTTPCLLINLGKSVNRNDALQTESGDRYAFPGGVGQSHSVVAYSAICAHRMTYPAKSASFINYRHTPVTFFDKKERQRKQSQIIYCCSERSVYDPLRGGKVLGGPAPQPLATILLDYNESEQALYAVGTAGGEKFDNFFEEFSFRLQLDFRVTDVAAQATDKAEVISIEEYTDTVVLC